MVTAQLVGFTERLNPFSKNIFALVRLDKTVIRIPVDHRQKAFILKEYPLGSDVDVWFDGQWSIKSRTAPPEFDLEHLIKTTF
jgi:hypothetical protein